jgi:hypothetical protein
VNLKTFVALVNAPVETEPTKPNRDQDAWLMKQMERINNVDRVKDDG